MAGSVAGEKKEFAPRYRYARTHESTYNVRASPTRREEERKGERKVRTLPRKRANRASGVSQGEESEREVPAPIQLASKQRVVIAKRNAHWGEDEGRSRLSLFFVPTRVVPCKSKGWSPSNDSERDFSMHRSNEHGEKKKSFSYVRTCVEVYRRTGKGVGRETCRLTGT